MILILTPDDIRPTSQREYYWYDEATIDDFRFDINRSSIPNDWIDTQFYNKTFFLQVCDTIIFQYPNEHRGMETRVLYKREE